MFYFAIAVIAVVKDHQDHLMNCQNEQENMTKPLQVTDDDDNMDPQFGVVGSQTLMACMMMKCNLKQWEERELQSQRVPDQREIQHNLELKQKDSIIAQLRLQNAQLLRRTTIQAQTQFSHVAEKYPMKKCPHGVAVIINNYKFHPSSVNGKILVLPNRRGSQNDEDNLGNTSIIKCVSLKIFLQ